MDATVGRFVDLDGDPLAAVTGIIVFILVVVASKNVVDFLRAYLTARVEQGSPGTCATGSTAIC